MPEEGGLCTRTSTPSCACTRTYSGVRTSFVTLSMAEPINVIRWPLEHSTVLVPKVREEGNEESAVLLLLVVL